MKSIIEKIRNLAGKGDTESRAEIHALLRKASARELNSAARIMEWNDLLLFLLAHPLDEAIEADCRAAVKRLDSILKKRKNDARLSNSGLPYQMIESTFSFEFVQWLMEQKDLHVELLSFSEEKVSLNNLLRMTLPVFEREYASIGYTADEILAELCVESKDRLPFIMQQFRRLWSNPYNRDFLFDAMNLHLRVIPRKVECSKLMNRLPDVMPYYIQGFQKRVDHKTLLETPLPAPRELSDEARRTAIDVVKRSMLLTVRETDPASYMDERSFYIYDLERGISVALYCMTADRQLAGETYMGYTLFRNGYPLSYGGAWIFGRRALFGINIYEAFRGGESAYVFCSLLRVYRQAFGVDYFEVEPYQYGADNPDGIKSGAFWFYYRFGFRPLDAELNALAHREAEKIKTKADYRSPEKVLLRFTESNIALNLGKSVPPAVSDYSHLFTKIVARKYKGRRSEAIHGLMGEYAIDAIHLLEYGSYLEEIVQLVAAIGLDKKEGGALILQLAGLRRTDLFAYNRLLKTLL